MPALADGMDMLKGIKKIVIQKMLTAESKYPKECNEARLDSMKRIISLINEW